MTRRSEDDDASLCRPSVSKHQLDVAFGPSGERMAVANDDRGVTRLVKLIAGRGRNASF